MSSSSDEKWVIYQLTKQGIKGETRQLKKTIMTFFKTAFISLLKYLVFAVSWNSKYTNVVLQPDVLAVYYFTLSTLRKYLRCQATKFYYIKRISIFMIKACRLNYSIAIKFCPSAQGWSKKIQHPSPASLFLAFLVWKLLFFLFSFQCLWVFTIHDKGTVQSIVGSQICFSGPFKSLAMT